MEGTSSINFPQLLDACTSKALPKNLSEVDAKIALFARGCNSNGLSSNRQLKALLTEVSDEQKVHHILAYRSLENAENIGASFASKESFDKFSIFIDALKEKAAALPPTLTISNKVFATELKQAFLRYAERAPITDTKLEEAAEWISNATGEAVTKEDLKTLYHSSERAMSHSFDALRRIKSEVGELERSFTEKPKKARNRIIKQTSKQILRKEEEIKKLKQEIYAIADMVEARKDQTATAAEKAKVAKIAEKIQTNSKILQEHVNAYYSAISYLGYLADYKKAASESADVIEKKKALFRDIVSALEGSQVSNRIPTFNAAPIPYFRGFEEMSEKLETAIKKDSPILLSLALKDMSQYSFEEGFPFFHRIFYHYYKNAGDFADLDAAIQDLAKFGSLPPEDARKQQEALLRALDAYNRHDLSKKDLP